MDELHELTAAYALDALEPGEARAYEEHLEDCTRCQEELASFAGTASALAYASAGATPPAELRGRILAAARAERAEAAEDAPERTNVVPLRKRLEARRGRNGSLLSPVAQIAAAAACLALALGLWNLSLHRSLEHKTALAAVLGDPSAKHVSMPKAMGELVVSKRGVALVAKVHHAPTGKTYEAWMIPKGGKPVAAGTFDGSGPVLLHGTAEPGITMAVTMEKDGGSSDGPTTDPIVAVKLA